MYAQPQMPRKPYFMRNFQRKEMTKMDETKKKFALWAYPSTMEKVERLYQLDTNKGGLLLPHCDIISINFSETIQQL